MKRFLVAASFAVLTCSAFALPSIGEVQAEIGKGHYTRAEEMTREVVAARPDSARARYVHAEILAHNQRYALAAEEAAQARRLDPGLSFTAPEKFKAFTQLLAREQASANTSPAAAQSPARFSETAPAHGGGVPLWAWGGAAGLLALLAWRALGARQPARTQWPPATPAAQSALSTGMPGAAGFGGYASAPPSAPPSAPAGGGMWGTGMAVAGGVAAGMLAEKLFESHRESSPGPASLSPSRASDPAPAEDRYARDAAADELQRRSIDMGSGDDWDADANGRRAAGTDDGW
jgi:hypothetical protein